MKQIINALASLMLWTTLTANEIPTSRLDELIRSQQHARLLEVSNQILAQASGADIVGNGTGIVEQNFKYAYRNLDRTISQCLSTPACTSDQAERELLIRMRQIVLDHRSDSNRLIFLKNSDFENFFHTELDPSERIAKTGFSSSLPIFINLSLAESLGMANDLSLIIGILAHELGHQAGMLSHSYLDDLAARLRQVYFEHILAIEFKKYQSLFKFIIFKGRNNFSYDETLMTINNEILTTPHLSLNYRCPRKMTLVGAELSNPHWQRPQMKEGQYIMSVRAWVEFSCESNPRWAPEAMRHNIEYHFILKPVLSYSGKISFELVESILKVD